MSIERVSFGINSEWFTNLLRDLSIENEIGKLFRIWESSFPNLSNKEIYNDILIKILSGKNKFINKTKGEFDLTEDGNIERFLFDSWEDIYKFNKSKLFLAELNLLAYKLQRIEPPIAQQCRYSSLKFLAASEENIEQNNIYNKPLALYFANAVTLKNKLEREDFDLESFPKEYLLFAEKNFRNKKDFQVKDSKKLNKQFHDFLVDYFDKEVNYFKNKYPNFDLSIYQHSDIQFITGYYVDGSLEDDERISHCKERIETPMELEDDGSVNKSDMINKMWALREVYEHDCEQFNLNTYPEEENKGFDLQTLIKNPKDTEFMSGFISPEGIFYGIPIRGHLYYEDSVFQSYYGQDEYEKIRNAGDELEERGWIKVSSREFTNHAEKYQVTPLNRFPKVQVYTLKDLAINWGDNWVLFNYVRYQYDELE